MKKLILFTLVVLIATVPSFAVPKKKTKKTATTTATTTATAAPTAQMQQSFLSFYSQAVASMKKQLPQKMDPVGEMTAIDFSSKTRCITMTFSVANQDLSEALKMDTVGSQLWCESTLPMMMGNPKTEPQVGEMMIACKINFKYVFKDSIGNVFLTKYVTAKRFAQYYKRTKLIVTADPKKMDLAYFKELVEISNQSATRGEKIHLEGRVIYDDISCDSASMALYKLFVPGGEDTLKAYFQNVAAGIEKEWKEGTGVDRLVAMERLNITEEMRLYDVNNNLMASYKFTPADLRNPDKDAEWNYFIYIINHQSKTEDYKTYFKDSTIVIETACNVEDALHMKYLEATEESMMRDNVAKTLVMQWTPYLSLIEQHGVKAEMRFIDGDDKSVVKTFVFTVEDLKNALKKLQQ